ncbi:hypothetical protein [Promicromonospora sp. NPDC059942]|uniref:hypothetical protein n=1 Tax=Promicromonospora sp. NPDC059942 TaxID=3347009 RepID=UPI0036517F79
MVLRQRIQARTHRQDVIHVVKDMRDRVEDLHDQTRIPPFDYFGDIEDGELTELLVQVSASMCAFVEAADQRLAQLQDTDRKGQR